MQTEKFEYKDKTYYIWVIDYQMKDYGKEAGIEMTIFLVLTEAQNDKLKNVTTKNVCFTQLPCYGTSTFVKFYKEESIIEGIKKALLEKNDISAYTYCLTARKEGEYVLFNYDVDTWTHSGDISKRTYEKLNLNDNLDGGYFKIPLKQWDNLFYR